MRHLYWRIHSESAVSIFALCFVITLAVILRMYNIENFRVLVSDEAIYAQSSYAISKGYVPYKDVFLAHPPLYFLIASFWMSLVGATLFFARFLNVLFGVGTIATIYFMCRKIFSTKVAVIASLFYAVLPLAVFFGRNFIIDNALGLFSTLTVFAFLMYNKYGSLKYLLLSGLLAGLSLITKFTAFQFIFFIFAALLSEKRFRNLGWFVSAILPVPVLTGLLLLANGILPAFIQESVYLQFLNLVLAQTLMEKANIVGSYLFWILPFFALALFTMVSPKSKEAKLITVWYLIPFALILLGNVVFFQYFIILNAPLCVLAALTVSGFEIPLSSEQLVKLRKKLSLNKILLVFIMLFFVSASLYFTAGEVLGNEENRIAQEAKIQSADYIKSITDPSDKIWVTDASIAFFAQRIIVPPDSEYYKYQGFFSGSFAYSEDGKYRGPFSSGAPTLLSLSQILSAWQTNKPKAIIIISTSFVDSLILNGIENPDYSEPGLMPYLTTHYNLTKTFDPIGINVWVRLVEET